MLLSRPIEITEMQQIKFQTGGLEIFQKIHEIYETFKLENFNPHL